MLSCTLALSLPTNCDGWLLIVVCLPSLPLPLHPLSLSAACSIIFLRCTQWLVIVCRLSSHLTHFVSAAPSCPLPPSPPLLTPPNAFFAETPTSFREEMMKRVPQMLAALGGEAQLNNLGHQNSALTLATSFEQ